MSKTIPQNEASILRRRKRIKGLFFYELLPGLTFPTPSKTKQSFAQEADINNIMSKYITTGHMVDPMVPRSRQPIYGDFTRPVDLLTIKTTLLKIESDFNRLPSHIRDRFNNSPLELLEFVQNPQNEAECVELRLLPPLKKPEATTPGTEKNGANAQPDTKKPDA